MRTLWGWYGDAGILLAALSIPLILGHVPPNHWYGFRTSKTLSSAKLWRAANHSTPAAEAAKVVASIPLGRMGTPEEFGRTLAWLASPAASYVHGQAVMFDGGAVRVPL